MVKLRPLTDEDTRKIGEALEAHQPSVLEDLKTKLGVDFNSNENFETKWNNMWKVFYAEKTDESSHTTAKEFGHCLLIIRDLHGQANVEG